MRYAQGGGLTAEGRRRRELVRLAAVESFERRVPVADIGAELRVSERSVQRWRRAWEAGGAPGLASKGQAARCRLDRDQLAELDRVLDAGPTASGWEDQRWTLARIRDLAAAQAGGRRPAVPRGPERRRDLQRRRRQRDPRRVRGHGELPLRPDRSEGEAQSYTAPIVAAEQALTSWLTA
jgi:transposase